MSGEHSDNRIGVASYTVLLVALQAVFVAAAVLADAGLTSIFGDSESPWLSGVITSQMMVVISSLVSLAVGGRAESTRGVVRMVGWADAGTLFFAAFTFLVSLEAGRLSALLAGADAPGAPWVFYGLAAVLISLFGICHWIAHRAGSEPISREAVEKDKRLWSWFFLAMLVAIVLSTYIKWLNSLPGDETATGRALLDPAGSPPTTRALTEFVLLLLVSSFNLICTFVLTWRFRESQILRRLGDAIPDSFKRPRNWVDALIAFLTGLFGLLIVFLRALAALWPIAVSLLMLAGLAAAGISAGLFVFFEADQICHSNGFFQWLCQPSLPWPGGSIDAPRLGSEGIGIGELPWYVWLPVGIAGLAAIVFVLPIRMPRSRIGTGVALLLFFLIGLLLLLLLGRSPCAACEEYDPRRAIPCACAADADNPLVGCTEGGCKCADEWAEQRGCACDCASGVKKDAEGYCRTCEDPAAVFNDKTGRCDIPPPPEPSYSFEPVSLPDAYWLCTNTENVVGAGLASCDGTKDRLLPSRYYLRKLAISGAPKMTPAMMLRARRDAGDLDRLCTAPAVIAIGSASSSGEERNRLNNRDLANERASVLFRAVKAVCGDDGPVVVPVALDRVPCGDDGTACLADDQRDRQLTVVLVTGTAVVEAAVPEDIHAAFNAWLLDNDRAGTAGPLRHVGKSGGFDESLVLVTPN